MRVWPFWIELILTLFIASVIKINGWQIVSKNIQNFNLSHIKVNFPKKEVTLIASSFLNSTLIRRVTVLL